MVSLLSKASRNSFLLIASGLILLSFGGISYYRVRILSFTSSPEAAKSQMGELPIQITIPSLKVDIPVEPAEIKSGVWEISYKNATFLNSSSRPGGGGNVVIYGHNKKAIFGSLPFISIGEKIFIKTNDNTIYTYKVISKETVMPDRVDLIYPTDEEILTLFTCTGPFDSQRVVVKAKPLK